MNMLQENYCESVKFNIENNDAPLELAILREVQDDTEIMLTFHIMYVEYTLEKETEEFQNLIANVN